MPEYKSVNGRWVPVDAKPAPQAEVVKEEPKEEPKAAPEPVAEAKPEEPKEEAPRRRARTRQ